MKNWNRRELEQLKKQGKIRDYHIPVHKKKQSNGTAIPERGSKQMDWMKWNLLYWCNERALEYAEELVFSEERKFRFDLAIPALKIAIEYEGGVHGGKPSHTSSGGVQRDIEKYNLAQSMGWKVIRLTAKTYTNMLIELNKIYML